MNKGILWSIVIVTLAVIAFFITTFILAQTHEVTFLQEIISWFPDKDVLLIAEKIKPVIENTAV